MQEPSSLYYRFLRKRPFTLQVIPSLFVTPSDLWFQLLFRFFQVHLSVRKYANKSVTSVGGIASNNPSGIMLILV